MLRSGFDEPPPVARYPLRAGYIVTGLLHAVGIRRRFPQQAGGFDVVSAQRRAGAAAIVGVSVVLRNMT